MKLIVILFLIAVCLLFRLIFGKKHLSWFILVFSILHLFYFQPVSGIKYLDFWIPSATLLIGISAWLIVSKKEVVSLRSTATTFTVIASIYCGFAIIRSGFYTTILEFINIPGSEDIFLLMLGAAIFLFILNRKSKKDALIIPMVLVLLILFIIIKNEYLSMKTSQFLRMLTNQPQSLADANEIIWIGYSYFAFRLLHVLLDSKQRGKISMSLHKFLGYLLFFPALLAGPIMRVDDYQSELEKDPEPFKKNILESLTRLTSGLIQKFIIADLLAIISLNPRLAQTVEKPGWMWFVVVMYAFRIFFDFNGYTNIAIGIALIVGIKLPENFHKPLRSPNLTIFWNRWHMTLTQWFRVYYFNPLTRELRRNAKFIDQSILLPFMQTSTMVLIGFWHGINLNFLMWGLWIGLGLYLQTLITNKIKQYPIEGKAFWQIHPVTRMVSIALTFGFISLGWIWFALDEFSTSLHVFQILFGVK